MFIRCDPRRRKHDPPRRASSRGDTKQQEYNSLHSKSLVMPETRVPSHRRRLVTLSEKPYQHQSRRGTTRRARFDACKTSTGTLKTRQTAGQQTPAWDTYILVAETPRYDAFHDGVPSGGVHWPVAQRCDDKFSSGIRSNRSG